MGFNIRSSSTEPIYEQKYWFFFGTLIRELFLLNSPLFLAAVRSFLRRTVRDHLIWAFQTILLFSLKLEKKGLNISSIQTSNFTFGLKQGFFNKTLKGGLEFLFWGLIYCFAILVIQTKWIHLVLQKHYIIQRNILDNLFEWRHNAICSYLFSL